MRHGKLIAAVSVGSLFLAGPALGQRAPSRSDIVGRVLEAGSRTPVESADIVLDGGVLWTSSDGRGRFILEDVSAGFHTLRVRHLGFESRERPIEVPAGYALGLTIRLAPKPVEIEPLVVEVQPELRVRRLQREGYYRRRDLGFGTFLGPQYLTRWSGHRVPALLERLGGARIHRRGTGRAFRVVFPRNQHRCSRTGAMFFVDGKRWGRTAPDFPATEIAAVEVYKGPSQLVGTTVGTTRVTCGLILVWTWHGPNPFHHSQASDFGCPLRVSKEGC